MATQILRPNGQVASSAPTIVPGGTTYGVMSDNLDTSYVSLAPGTYTWQNYTNPSPAIPAGSIIKRVSSRLRSRKASSAGVAISSGLYRPLGGDSFQVAYGNVVVPNSVYFQTATWFSYENAEVNLGGSAADDANRTPTGPQDPALVYPPMTIADVDNLSIRISSFYSGTNWYVAESYLDVVYVPKPVVATITTVPATPINDDDTPTVNWTTTLDTDGGLQTKYEVKIFDTATYSGGGFNASTSTPDATSGVVASGGTSYTPTTKLVNDTYRAYIRVAQTVAGQDLWSDWVGAIGQFVVNVLSPAVPTVTATADNANGRISVGVTAGGGGATTTTSMEAQSSSDGGVTWEHLRNGFALASPATVLDYEAANGVATRYRARGLHLFASGTSSTSAWSTATVTATWSSVDYWLKHPTNPALNCAVTLRSQPERVRAARQGVFRPLGRSYPVVISDTRVEWTGTIAFLSNSDAKRNALVAILEEGVPLLLQGPATAQNWDDAWVMFGDLQQDRALDAAHGAITFDQTSWIKVERPTTL